MRVQRGVRRSLTEDKESEKDDKISSPRPVALKEEKTEKNGDYRDYLLPLLSFIRFPFMKMQFFCEKVLPLGIIHPSQSTPLLQFYSHPSIPETSILWKVTRDWTVKKRKAQSLGFRGFHITPQSPPIVFYKERSIYIETSLFPEEELVVKFRRLRYDVGKTLVMGVRFPEPLPIWAGAARMGFFGQTEGLTMNHLPILLDCVFTSNPGDMRVSCPTDGEQIASGSGTFNWKEKFLRLRELIIVLKKYESSEDSSRVLFEANVVVNDKMQFRFHFNSVKTDPLAREAFFVVPCLSVHYASRSGAGVGRGIKKFVFEVFDEI